MMIPGIAQWESTTQRGEGNPTQPRAVLRTPQFGSKMKYQTTATAAPDSTVGVNRTVRAALRNRSFSFKSSARDSPRASVRPTEPTVNVAVFRAICQNWPLVSTLIQLSRPTNAAKVDHSRHSRLGRAVSGRSVVRVAALTIGCGLG